MLEETNAREDSTVIMVEWGLGRGLVWRASEVTTISDFFRQQKIFGGVQNFKDNNFAD
jgi:hypothetical protein